MIFVINAKHQKNLAYGVTCLLAVIQKNYMQDFQHTKTAQPPMNLDGTLILKTGVKVKLGLVLMTGN